MDINKFQKLGMTKYMWVYYLMCPKTKESHINIYKNNNIPIPEYLDENKLLNYTNKVDKVLLYKLTKNINKKYINQKYLDFLNKINFNQIEHFNYNINYFLIILLILIIIYGILNKFF